MKIAIAHDWLVTYAGAEKVLEQLVNLYPQADLYSLIDFLPDAQRGFINGKKSHTSFIQKLPFAKTKYRHYLPFMPLAIEQFDLSKYDLIISSSSAVAKGVIVHPHQTHISYMHSPMRYAWDMQYEYLEDFGVFRGPARFILHKIRQWDAVSSNRVDYFVANSEFVANRINKCYRRDAVVIYPPVDVSAFSLSEDKEDFYMTASRLVPYKKIDLIVKAFVNMPDKKLVIIGNGQDYKKILGLAIKSPNISVLGYQPFNVLRDYMQRAKAFVFAGIEDFGIVAVEAQACGTPVIAYSKGGIAETAHGLLFHEQTVESIINAVNTFELASFDPALCRNNAMRFSVERFKTDFSAFVQRSIGSVVL